MRHRRRTDLTHEEGFFEFEDFRALQREDFVIDAAQGTSADRENRHEFRLVVAGNVPSDGRLLKTQNFAGTLLNGKALILHGSQGTDGARQFTDKHAVVDFFQAFAVAAQFIGPDGSLITERDGKRVHDVGAPRHRGVAVLLCEIEAVLHAELHVAQDDLVSVALQKNDAGIDDILARGTPVNEFTGAIRKNRLKGLQKGNDRNGGLVELADRRDVKEFGLGVFIDEIGLFLRNDAEFGLCFGQSGFGVEPLLSPGTIRERFTHFVRGKHATVNLAVDGGRGHNETP